MKCVEWRGTQESRWTPERSVSCGLNAPVAVSFGSERSSSCGLKQNESERAPELDHSPELTRSSPFPPASLGLAKSVPRGEARGRCCAEMCYLLRRLGVFKQALLALAFLTVGKVTRSPAFGWSGMRQGGGILQVWPPPGLPVFCC